ncbi:MAG: hypothetical protein JNK04_04030, partial [Myxococcales bacterium]|nr:hypothetical protein [Myxococcales bacterium]
SVTQLPDDTINGALEHENGRISVRDLRELGALEKPGPTIQGSPLDDDYVDIRASAAARGSAPGLSQPGRSQPGASQPGVSPSQPGLAPPSSAPGSLPHMPHAEEGHGRGRMVALIIAVLVLVPVGAFAAVKLFVSHGTEADPVAAQLEQAQEALEKRAWDAPPGANVKELTDRMLNESPGDRRVLGLRRAAADGILTDALALRDSGRPEEALRLAKLALTFAPDLAPAQKLASEIERADSPNVDTAPPPMTSSSAKPRTTGKPGPVGSGPTSTGKPAPSATGTGSDPGLAPPTPPDPTPPTPGSSRPWL